MNKFETKKAPAAEPVWTPNRKRSMVVLLSVLAVALVVSYFTAPKVSALEPRPSVQQEITAQP